MNTPDSLGTVPKHNYSRYEEFYFTDIIFLVSWQFISERG